tara:strand:- start:452 stop:595 length:144 start_codon:yes stop_codon:yes gene_type:complete
MTVESLPLNIKASSKMLREKLLLTIQENQSKPLKNKSNKLKMVNLQK